MRFLVSTFFLSFCVVAQANPGPSSEDSILLTRQHAGFTRYRKEATLAAIAQACRWDGLSKTRGVKDLAYRLSGGADKDMTFINLAASFDDIVDAVANEAVMKKACKQETLQGEWQAVREKYGALLPSY